MGSKPNWKQEELDYLTEKWGSSPIKSIAQKLGRSESAVILKAQRLGLGAFLQSGDYITVQELYRALGIRGGTGYKNISWIENRGLPVTRKRVRNCYFRVIKIDAFWEWANKNQSILDFSYMPKGTLGIEPYWVKEKRRQDERKAAAVTQRPWTGYDDERLRGMLKAYRYTTDAIAHQLGRTEGAVIRRISTLGLKYRPLRNSPHNSWTEEEIDIVEKMIATGANYTTIAAAVPRHSEKAVRGLMTRRYGTEQLDRIRKVINSGKVSQAAVQGTEQAV